MASSRDKSRKAKPKRRSPSVVAQKASRLERKAPQLHDTLTTALEQAQQLCARGDAVQGLALYQRTIQADPHNIRAFLMCAHAYASQFQLKQARAVLKALCRISPSSPEPHQKAAEVYEQIRCPELALQCYEQAATCPGASPLVWVKLAAAYERVHRLEEAEELVARAVRADSTLYEAYLVRARIQRRQKKSDSAAASLHTIIQALPEAHDLSGQALGELATLLDEQGDYDGAFAAIARCKQAQLSQSETLWKNSEHTLKRFTRMFDNLTQADLAQFQDAGKDWTPQRLATLTGFPRSGTTLLEQVLDAHPDLISAEECNYYAQTVVPELARDAMPGAPIDRLLRHATQSELLSHRERFFVAMEQFLGEPIRGRLHLDKNPALMVMLPVQLRIFPEMRLLIALRDPRDILVSCYLRYLPLNPMSVRFLTPERTAQRYATDMRCWLRLREIIRTPFCELRYEDTVADLPAQARRALKALGLPWNDQVLGYRDRLLSKTVSSPSYDAVTQPIYSRRVGRFRHYEKQLGPALEILEPFLREFGYS